MAVVSVVMVVESVVTVYVVIAVMVHISFHLRCIHGVQKPFIMVQIQLNIAALKERLKPLIV